MTGPAPHTIHSTAPTFHLPTTTPPPNFQWTIPTRLQLAMLQKVLDHKNKLATSEPDSPVKFNILKCEHRRPSTPRKPGRLYRAPVYTRLQRLNSPTAVFCLKPHPTSSPLGVCLARREAWRLSPSPSHNLPGEELSQYIGRSGPTTWTHSTSLCVPEGLLGGVDPYQQGLRSLQVCPSVSGAQLGLKQPLSHLSTTPARDQRLWASVSLMGISCQTYSGAKSTRQHMPLSGILNSPLEQCNLSTLELGALPLGHMPRTWNDSILKAYSFDRRIVQAES